LKRRLLPATLALVLPLLSSLACSESTPPPPAPDKPEAPAHPPTGNDDKQPAEPVRASTPSHLEEAPLKFSDRVKLPELPAADKPPANAELAWNLETPRRVDYSYKQEMMADQTQPMTGKRMKQTLHVDGMLTVESKVAGTADVVLREAEMKQVVEGVEAAKQPPARKLPVKVYPGLISKNPKEPPEDVAVAYMLLVPSQPLEPGKPHKEPVSMPFNASGTKLQAQGELTTTLDGFVKCGERVCASVTREMRIQQLDVPESLPGVYEVRVLGRGQMLFDSADGSLFAWRGATRMAVFAEPEVPAAMAEGQAASSQPKGMEAPKVHMDQHHYHALDRTKVTQ
jgi:hypothetical protein